MKTLPVLLLLFCLPFVALATPLCVAVPILNPDSIPICVGDPHVGQAVYAIPDSVWLVGFNDNPDIAGQIPGLVNAVNDWDYNDLLSLVRFSGDGENLFFQNLGMIAAYDDRVCVYGFCLGRGLAASWVIPGSYTGQLLPMQGYVLTTGDHWDAPGVHYWVSEISGPPKVPEPLASLLLGSGLLLVGILGRIKKCL